jgi:PHP family Zn ribbon phosphoesterase
VVELEKRQPLAEKSRLTSDDSYRYIIPLPELIAQTLGVADTSKKVQAAYQKILNDHGNELSILLAKPESELDALGAVGACIRAVRAGCVLRKGGYDGEYGVVKASVECANSKMRECVNALT